MQVLLTGSAGFLGRHLHAALEERGDEVVAVDIVDGNDCFDLFRTCDSAFDLVLHCAAVEPHRTAIDSAPLKVGAGNLALDAAMFDWAARTRPSRIVYFSSSAAYPTYLQGNDLRCQLRERDVNLDNPDAPDAIYGWVKLTGERLAAAYRSAGGAVTVARTFSGYGEDQSSDFPFGAFRDRALRKDDPFEIWGDGTQVRDWVHVDDLVGAILAAYEHGVDGPVNLCTGRPTSFNELARMFAEQAGYEPELKHLTDAPRGVAYRVGDPTLLHTFYEPKVSLEYGIRRALAA